MPLIWTIIVIAALFILIVVWRVLSTVAGTHKRRAYITGKLTPLSIKLRAGAMITNREIRELADRPELRIDLYHLLKYFRKQQHFPKNYLSTASMGEAALAHWLIHPNEYGKVPSKMEFVRDVKQPFGDMTFTYAVFKFMDDHHDRWTVGVAGPFLPHGEPYAGYPGTFSTFEPFDAKSPEEHVAWLHETMIKRGVYKNLHE